MALNQNRKITDEIIKSQIARLYLVVDEDAARFLMRKHQIKTVEQLSVFISWAKRYMGSVVSEPTAESKLAKILELYDLEKDTYSTTQTRGSIVDIIESIRAEFIVGTDEDGARQVDEKIYGALLQNGYADLFELIT